MAENDENLEDFVEDVKEYCEPNTPEISMEPEVMENEKSQEISESYPTVSESPPSPPRNLSKEQHEKFNDIPKHQRKFRQRNRRCRRQLRDAIGKRIVRNEELGKREVDLRRRLEVLECSMPAVMVWNMWRTAQGGPTCNLRRVFEKQFTETEVLCPSSPSQHFDCRVREAEAERKMAQRRAEEAGVLWREKLAALNERKVKLEEARKIQEERKEKIERLSEETKRLKEELKEMDDVGDGFCEQGECGDIKCRQRWIGKISSTSSIGSSDVECLESLQKLAEAEINIKRQIADLERKEEAYMRTLKETDEIWGKGEADTTGVLSDLQERLDSKVEVNQRMAQKICELEDELEKVRKKMAMCTKELERFIGTEKIEEAIGREDDIAEVLDKTVAIAVELEDEGVLAKEEVVDEETLAVKETVDGGVLAREEIVDEETSTVAEVEVKEAIDEEVLAKEETVDEQTSIEEAVLEEKKMGEEEPDEILLEKTQIEKMAVRKMPETREILEDEIWEEETEILDEEISEERKGADEEILEDEEMFDEGVASAAEEKRLLDKEISAKEETFEVATGSESISIDYQKPEVKAKVKDLGVDRQEDLLKTTEVEIQPEEDYESEALKEVKEYLAKFGSPEELDYDKEYEPCPPDFVCNDEVFTETGMDDKELATLESKVSSGTAERRMEKTAVEVAVRKIPDVVEAVEIGEKVTLERTQEERMEKPEETKIRDRPPGESVPTEIAFETAAKIKAATSTVEKPIEKVKEIQTEKGSIVIPQDKLISWLSTVNLIRGRITRCPSCRDIKTEADDLAKNIGGYAGVDIEEIPDEDMAKDKKIEEELKVEEAREEAAVEPMEKEKEKLKVKPIPDIPGISVEPEIKIVVEGEMKPEIKIEDTEGGPKEPLKVEVAAISEIEEKPREDLEVDGEGIEKILDTTDEVEPKELTVLPLEAPTTAVEKAFEVSIETEEKLDEAASPSEEVLPTEYPVEPMTTPTNGISKEDGVPLAEQVARKIEAEIEKPGEGVEGEEKIPLPVAEEVSSEVPEVKQLPKEITMEDKAERIESWKEEEAEVTVAVVEKMDEEISEVEAEAETEVLEKREEEEGLIEMEAIKITKRKEEVEREGEEEEKWTKEIEGPSEEIKEKEKSPLFVEEKLKEAPPLPEVEPEEIGVMELPLKEEEKEEIKQIEKIEASAEEPVVSKTEKPREMPPAVDVGETVIDKIALATPVEDEVEKLSRDEAAKEIKEVVEEVPVIKEKPVEEAKEEEEPLLPPTKPLEVKEKPRALIDPRLAEPYPPVAEKRRELIPRRKATCFCKPLICPLMPKMKTIEVIKTRIMKKITVETQTTSIHSPELSTRRTRWKKCTKESSRTITSTISSQTEKPVIRNDQKHPADDDPEREIRFINYGKETEKLPCDCCSCGKSVSTPATLTTKLIQTPRGQIPLKKRILGSRINRETQVEGMRREQMQFSQTARLRKLIKRPSCDREICTCPTPSRSRRKRIVERRDQGCLVKILKTKPKEVEKVEGERGNQSSLLTEKSSENSLQDCICLNEANEVVCKCGED